MPVAGRGSAAPRLVGVSAEGLSITCPTLLWISLRVTSGFIENSSKSLRDCKRLKPQSTLCLWRRQFDCKLSVCEVLFVCALKGAMLDPQCPQHPPQTTGLNPQRLRVCGESAQSRQDFGAARSPTACVLAFRHLVRATPSHTQATFILGGIYHGSPYCPRR